MFLTPVIAILCITAILVIAVANNVDGMLLAGGLTIIGGLGGWEAKIIKDKIKGGK